MLKIQSSSSSSSKRGPLCLLSMHKKSPIWSSILVSRGKLPTLKFTLFGQGRRKEQRKRKIIQKVFAPSLLTTLARATYFREGQFEKKADQTTETKFHRSKNSLIQLFLKTHCPKCHYFLSFLNICNTFILHGPGNKTVHILLTKLLFFSFRYDLTK